MKIEITGEPKEIAALVLAVQERQSQSNLQQGYHLRISGDVIHCAPESRIARTSQSSLTV